MNFKEMIQLLKSASSADEINKSRDKIEALIPSIRVMFDYDQKNHTHPFDLWMHSVHTVANLPRNMEDDMMYLGALLHDIGKPDCQCRSNRPEDIEMHYYGHPQRSMEIVRDMVIPYLETKGFGLSELEAKRLIYYVTYHDDRVSLKLKHMNRHMKMASFEEFKHLMLLQVADAKAHVQIPIIAQRVEVCSAMAAEKGEELFQRYLLENKR